MAKPAKSQWEFGELFPAEALKRVLTVSELAGSIRRTLEKELGKVSVMGEVTSLRMQPSGHIYFSIKDANAQVACVLFRNEARSVARDFLEEGQKVVIDGEITLYEARGQCQVRVLSLQLQGLGALQAAFERLKQKLQAEGLFDSERKRAIPRYAQHVGLVTSASGAAIRDVLHAMERRNPGLEVVLAPCRVQGAGAAPEIAAAIHLLNEWAEQKNRLDVIVVTRGGGSPEDLWAFNEEIVARAIYSSKVPVISGVGHEIDFTISDFVADFRAATPTAAAEIITEGVFSARQFVSEARGRLREWLQYSLSQKKEELADAGRRLGRMHPQRRLEEQTQRIDELQESIIRCLRTRVREAILHWQAVSLRFARVHPEVQVCRRKEALALMAERLRDSAMARIDGSHDRVSRAVTRLGLLSPANVLKRGYSITTDARTGRVLRDASEAKPGSALRTRLAQGEVRSTVDR